MRMPGTAVHRPLVVGYNGRVVHNAYAELVLLLVAAALAGLIALRLRLPLLLGYILVGVLAGPVGFGWLGAREDIQLFAQIGLTLLLFVVGLRLDLHIIRTLGRTALIAGAGQILITGVLGYLLALALGIPPAATPLVALGLALSSTIVAVKLLSDRHEIDALHGRLALGILIIQDLAAVMALFILSTGATPLDGHAAASGWVVLLRGVGLLVGAWLAAFYVLPRLLRFIAQSTELLVIAAIAWALLVAYLSELAGFGQEVGAFIAGVTLASTPYREVLGAKLASVRDFLLLFFFVQLGATLTFAAPGRQLFIAVPLILFTLTVKPAAIMAILGAMGYRPRTSFLAGITLAQVSEFSLILLAQATLVGLVPRDIASALTLVALVTIAVSSVMVANGRSIYQVLAPRLHRFAPLMRRQHDEAPPEHLDIILFGLGAYGTGIAQHLREADRVVLGIDFDPQVVEGWRRRGWPALFGDAEDVDYVCALPLERARWVVSTIRDPGINRALALALRQARYAGNLAFTTRERGLGMPLLEEHPGCTGRGHDAGTRGRDCEGDHARTDRRDARPLHHLRLWPDGTADRE
jgi:Kef-type K+ transport system membrane component KefB